MQLVQQVCRAHSLTHMSGDSWARPCRMITYTEHNFQTHQLQFRDGKSHRGHILENFVLTKKKYIYIYIMEKHRYTCRLCTRRLLQLQYLYPRKYAGHVYIQYWTAKIFTRSSTETFKKWTKQINETSNIHGLLSITIIECPLLFYLRIEHY